MKDCQIEKIWVDRKVRDNPLVKTVVSTRGDAQVEFVCGERVDFLQKLSCRQKKQSLFLTEFPGSFIKSCPGTKRGYLCCGYTTINQPVGCPLDCSYCILQDYLSSSPLTLYVNTDELTNQLDNFLSRDRDSFLRIGNGELSDSLALDYISNISSFFISYFAGKKNVVFEFKTKTNRIENIMRLPPSPNIVVSWSLNPERIVKQEEHLTASLKQRLSAALKVQNKGFMVGFHFDPLIFYSGWEKDYEELIEKLFSLIDPSRILWISLGALRFPPSLKGIIQERFPQTRIIYEEMIRGMDGKLRYIKPVRINMFKKIYRLVKKRAPDVFCYLCMESPDVWEKVTGFSPQSNLHFKNMFDEHCQAKLGVIRKNFLF